jgi:hypothetical protein
VSRRRRIARVRDAVRAALVAVDVARPELRQEQFFQRRGRRARARWRARELEKPDFRRRDVARVFWELQRAGVLSRPMRHGRGGDKIYRVLRFAP